MNVNYTDSVKQWPDGYALAQRTTNRLVEEVLGKSAGSVRVNWNRAEGGADHDSLQLRLEDLDGHVVDGKLALDELRSPGQTKFRLHRLWLDMLQVRSEEMLRNLIGTED